MAEIIRTKTCTKCKIEKPYNEFHKRKDRPIGISAHCKECAKVYNKKYRSIRGKEYAANKWQEFYYKNREQNIKRVVEYQSKRASIDDIYAEKLNRRIDLWNAITRNYNANKIFSILNVNSCEDLRNIIQSRFKEGMTWNNYGRSKENWCIDHIKPLKTAKTIEEVHKLFNIDNLTPLWVKDNLQKSGSY